MIKRLAIILLAVAICIAPAVSLSVGAAPASEKTNQRVDTVTGATPNYRTFLKNKLKGMPVTGGNYTCLKSQDPFTYFSQDWYGVNLSYLLDVEVGLKPDTTAIKVIAADGYSATLTMAELRDANPQGLRTILGWRQGQVDTTGGPLEELADDEGPFRVIVPQAIVGPHGVGTENWNKAVKMVRAIEVQPTAPGLPSADFTKIPPGQIIIYGNILNRRSFTLDELKSIKRVTGKYHWLNTFPTEGDTTFTGIPLDYLVEQVVGTLDGATGATVTASDGYSATFTLDRMRAQPGGLPMLLAWNEDGADLAPEPGGEGPLKVVRAQTAPDDTNKIDWIKWVRVIRVEPKGTDPVPSGSAVPQDRIIVCGSADPRNVPSTWYLAEGYTGQGFEEWICIGNPNSWKTTVNLKYMIEGEGTRTQQIKVEAQSRATVRVNDAVGDGKNVSAVVEGTHGDSIVAERSLYWNGRNGGHCAAGVNAPATAWYLAEGSTAGTFETWVLVQNPGDTEASVGLTYMTPSGEKQGPQGVKVPPMSRKTFAISDTVTNEFSVSTKVTSDKPIIAERAMYWNNRAAGHCAAGVTTPGTEWYMAEGCTAGGFETWILLQNPGDSPAKANITYMDASGEKAGPTLDMPAHSRVTVNAADTLRDDWQVSTKVTSDRPVIAERAVYWNGRKGGHCESAVDSPKFRSILAEGATAGGFESWILVQNPGPSDATVNITYLTGEGPKERAPLEVPAGTRVSVDEASDVGENFQVSAEVNSTAPVAVERAVYWSGRIEGSCSKGYLDW